MFLYPIKLVVGQIVVMHGGDNTMIIRQPRLIDKDFGAVYLYIFKA